MITIGEIKKEIIRELISKNIPDSQFEAISIISYSLRIDKKEVITENNFEISNKEKDLIYKILKERLEGNPLAYLINEKYFFNKKFYINKNVLIPRQETEEVIEYFFSINKKQSMKNKNILDIGTGSGIIPIICKKEYPESNLFSIDQSKEAIEVAKKNAYLQNVLINFECNKIENCGLDKIDFVISNPPYIKEEKLISLQKEVLKEPKSALNGGVDGLSVIKNIFEWEKNINKNKALQIIIEIDENIKDESKNLAQSFYVNRKVEVINDISKKPRILSIS